MEKAIIFNIQRYSLHDGGGIRTVVFFKGCPLRCPWCSNPESQSFTAEMIRKERLCTKCSSSSVYECRVDPEYCPTGALEILGKEYTVKEVLEEVKKDIVFYETTGGGVTLSGGEPLSQGIFVIELLKELKKLGINTAVETTGMGSFDIINQVADNVDTFLWDFKIMDKIRSLEIVHADVELMKSNFEKLMKKSSTVKVIPRLPLIPGYTSDKSNIKDIIDFIVPFGIKEVHLLPFHQYGSSKYKALGQDYILKDTKPLIKDEIEVVQNYIQSRGITAVIGGN
ncbi:MAG: glycyl-radical enzyme activating protein [Clostridiaceae bacterium]|nr:glycyl-radical enzyme activating protein [Clostridiaceae bacterium]